VTVNVGWLNYILSYDESYAQVSKLKSEWEDRCILGIGFKEDAGEKNSRGIEKRLRRRGEASGGEWRRGEASEGEERRVEVRGSEWRRGEASGGEGRRVKAREASYNNPNLPTYISSKPNHPNIPNNLNIPNNPYP
jgi:hypothetical protein